MLRLNQWVKGRLEARKKIVTFDKALLSGNFFPYVYFRFKYFFLNQILKNIVVHIVEFFFLINLFAVKYFAYLVLLRISFGLLTGFWWGATEVLRSSVRQLVKNRSFIQIKQEVACGLMLTAFLAMVVVGIGIYYVINYCTFENQQITKILRILSVIIICEFGLQLIQQVYHSGIYALHRIRRPLVSFFIPQTFYLLILFFGKALFGLSTILVAYSIFSFTNLCVGFYYTLQCYKDYQLNIDVLPSLAYFKGFMYRFFSIEFVAAGISNVALQSENIVIFWLFSTFATEQLGYKFSFLVYFLLPLMQASSSWVRVFYFDLKKHQIILKYLIKRIHRQMLYAASFTGVLLWLIANALSISYFTSLFSVYLVIFLFILILKSITAYLQIYAFCVENYISVIVSSIFIFITFLFGLMLGFPHNLRIILLIFSMLLTFGYIYFTVTRLMNGKLFRDNWLIFSDWLKKLNMERNKIAIGYIILSPKMHKRYHYSCLNLLNQKLGKLGNLTALNDQLIMYYQKEPVCQVINNIWLTIAMPGFIEKHELLSLATNGANAIQAAKQQGLFQVHFRPFLHSNVQSNDKVCEIKTASFIPPTINNDISQIISVFKQSFPDGICSYSLHKERSFGKLPDKINYSELKEKLEQYLYYPLSRAIAVSGDLNVSLAYDEVGLPVIFFIPRAHENKDQIRYWIEFLFKNTASGFC